MVKLKEFPLFNNLCILRVVVTPGGPRFEGGATKVKVRAFKLGIQKSSGISKNQPC